MDNSLKLRKDLVLDDLKQRLHCALGDNLNRIVLFGSRARGDAEDGSDYDILLLVNSWSREIEEIVDEIAYEMLDQCGVVVVIFVFENSVFEKETWEPLFCNIRREGVIL